MKLFIYSLFLTLSGSVAFGGTVDLGKSQVNWTGSKVVGYSHNGTVAIKSADLQFSKGEPSSAKIVIDMTSIKNLDITDAEKNGKLVGHLKSDDFFGVNKYPTALLTIDKVAKVDDKNYQLSGTLKIKDKTQPVKMAAKITGEDKKSKTVSVDFKFDRAKFDVRYGSGTFFSNLGDKMISDDVAIQVKLVVNKSKQFAQN